MIQRLILKMKILLNTLLSSVSDYTNGQLVDLYYNLNIGFVTWQVTLLDRVTKYHEQCENENHAIYQI